MVSQELFLAVMSAMSIQTPETVMVAHIVGTGHERGACCTVLACYPDV